MAPTSKVFTFLILQVHVLMMPQTYCHEVLPLHHPLKVSRELEEAQQILVVGTD